MDMPMSDPHLALNPDPINGKTYSRAVKSIGYTMTADMGHIDENFSLGLRIIGGS